MSVPYRNSKVLMKKYLSPEIEVVEMVLGLSLLAGDDSRGNIENPEPGGEIPWE